MAKKFSEIEIDAIGEIMNISLGASATAISTMLDTRVDITTPTVNVVTKDEFSFTNLQPAVGVEITYISGLDGKNIMLLKRHDVKIIVDLLMGMETPEEEFQLDEMNISAVCEVMNQMMGASSTALSEFLGRVVNISTPTSFEIESEMEFKDKYFEDSEQKVVVGFILNIDGKMESEFVNVMGVELAKELLAGFLPEDMIQEEETEAEPQTSAPQPASPVIPESTPAAAPTPMETPVTIPIPPVMNSMPAGNLVNPAPTAAIGSVPMETPVPPASGAMTMPVQPMISNEAYLQQQLLMQQMMQQMQQMQEQLARVKERENKIVGAKNPTHPELKGIDNPTGEQAENLDLVMGVPLEVSVEIGRTQSLVRDILEYTKGTLVVLDKQAGDQVDLFVNGQCIAKGDVVVVDDNFGIRITEILK